ncbi:3-deoxy-manno-octulosonate cytidylyltransferase [Flexistipes sinusarabici DSM 4947]|uniref:3-deoxy-manno-octulosonate cytidylyltransferase n=1 Tax=Flexistipes sinusarabici (strain ATCC 49648 / DSM 4947 / MAS 10) TaxID=717231 RepID=F8E5D9_FLESM|nr:3-deoxy-manno-octulosonate cytidylyltransferase [Flexistipes sinusarabici]AEI14635.1 3-deoxy-manno-octulosonate cytidylyltransferase [Flexistipes sinusarabici DSM 4947]
MSAVIIPARYNSSRLPGKPLVKIGGIPMIARVANNCLKSVADRVIVATDDIKIMEICEKIDGLEVTLSDKEYFSGTDRISDVAKYLREDIIVNVQGDEPFLSYKLINDLINSLKDNDNIYMSSAYVNMNETEADDPGNVKVAVDREGYALYFSRAKIPFGRNKNVAQYKKHIGIYGFKRHFLLKYAEMDRTPLEKTEELEQLRALENGYRIKMIESDNDSLSIDTYDDVKKAEKILERGVSS